MLLTARALDNVVNVNTYDVVKVLQFTENDSPSIYLQLVDAAKERPEQGFSPAGRRYMPATGATLTAVIDNLDDAKLLTKVAVQPYAQDPSIWRIDLATTDWVKGTCSVKLTLTEGAKITYGLMDSVLRVQGT